MNKRSVSKICDECRIPSDAFNSYQTDLFERGHMIFEASEIRKHDSRKEELISAINVKNKIV